MTEKKPYTPPLLLTDVTTDEATADRYAGLSGADLDAAMLTDWGIDVRRRCTIGRCPFCGGTYAAGMSQKDGHVVKLGHTLPHCERFAAWMGKKLEFLRLAKNAGAELRFPGGRAR